MATPIREACLTADDQPNENSGRVQAALDKKGCMCVNRPGGRCKAPVVFDATERYSPWLAEYGVYTRPGGPAPDGKTWSFALGNWQDEDYLLLHTPK